MNPDTKSRRESLPVPSTYYYATELSQRSYKYRAFITYAHKDEERARWLRQNLSLFVPKHLVGTDGDFGKVPARLYPIFRDRDELAGAAQLGPLIEQALDDSSHLIVLCSPQAVRSRWVNEEIGMFRHGQSRPGSVPCRGRRSHGRRFEWGRRQRMHSIGCSEGRRYRGKLTDHKHEPAAADFVSADGRKTPCSRLSRGCLGWAWMISSKEICSHGKKGLPGSLPYPRCWPFRR